MSAINHRFGILPIEAFYDELLTPAEFRMLAVLYSFRDKNANTVWPKLDSIMERAGYSDTTQVSRMTTKLEKKGWLTKGKKRGPRGPKIYELTVPERVQIGRNSQVDSERQVDISEHEKAVPESQVDRESQVDNSGHGEGVNLTLSVNSQLDRDGQLSNEHTSVIRPINQQTSSDPSGSAPGGAKPVDNSRLDRLGVYYDYPDQGFTGKHENLFSIGVRIFARHNVPEERARSVLGMLKSEHGERATLDALTELVCCQPGSGDPIADMRTLLSAPRKPMPKEWQPSGAALSNLKAVGIPDNIINDARATFRLWVQERDATSADFDEWFKRWVVRDFEDAELNIHVLGGWYRGAARQEFREPPGGYIGDHA